MGEWGGGREVEVNDTYSLKLEENMTLIIPVPKVRQKFVLIREY